MMWSRRLFARRKRKSGEELEVTEGEGKDARETTNREGKNRSKKKEGKKKKRRAAGKRDEAARHWAGSENLG